MTNYPNTIDDSTSLPPASGDDAVSINALISAVEAVEIELGLLPAGVYASARTRLDILEARINNPNAPAPNVTNPFFIGNSGVSLQAATGDPNVLHAPGTPGSLFLRQDGNLDQGLYTFRNDGYWHMIPTDIFSAGCDLAGTITCQTVVGIQGNPVAVGLPSTGDVLTWTGIHWAPQARSADFSYIEVDGYISNGPPSLAAQTGFIRNPRAVATILTARNFAGTGDITLLGTDASDNILLGDASNTVLIEGDLTVLGTTTTVESTVIDLVGRVVHGNWTTVASVAPPTFITGYSVHRGSNGSNVQNDGAALIWVEGAQVVSGSDGHWVFATIPNDIDTVHPSGLTNILQAMAGSFAVSATPNPTASTLPSVGGLRTQNNTTAVSARDFAGAVNLLLLGTDASNHALYDLGGLTAGHIFNTSSGSLYNFQVNGASQVQLSTSNITFPVGVISPVISQASTNTASATGQSLTVSAQGSTGTSGIGGNLLLNSGFGTFEDGYVELQNAGVAVASAGFSKFIHNQGFRRNVTPIGGNYPVLITDELVVATSLSGAITVTLPAAPFVGDTYQIKDATGTASGNHIVVSGNGNNIDGASTNTISTDYGTFTVTFTGSSWSIV